MLTKQQKRSRATSSRPPTKTPVKNSSTEVPKPPDPDNLHNRLLHFQELSGLFPCLHILCRYPQPGTSGALYIAQLTALGLAVQEAGFDPLEVVSKTFRMESLVRISKI
jgi:hypothetical protein